MSFLNELKASTSDIIKLFKKEQGIKPNPGNVIEKYISLKQNMDDIDINDICTQLSPFMDELAEYIQEIIDDIVNTNLNA